MVCHMNGGTETGLGGDALISRPSLLVADGVGQTAGRDQTDQLDGGDTERHPGDNVTGTVQELGQPAQAAAGKRHAQRSGSAAAAARLREAGDAIVQEATLATALQL